MDFTLDRSNNEEEFIAACTRKERWAQRQLYEEYYPQMMGVCLRYASNKEDALDILHDGFLKVFRHIAKYQAGTSLKAWIKRIMVNTSIDYYRKQVRRRTEDIDQAYNLFDKSPDPVSILGAEQLIELVQLLSPVYRTVFNLYVVEGYPHKEIASKLGISESTSRSNLVKARAKLKELIRKKLGNYE